MSSENRQQFLSLLVATGKSTATRKEIRDLCTANGLKTPQWFISNPMNQSPDGNYIVPLPNVPELEAEAPNEVAVSLNNTLKELITPKPLKIQSIVTELVDQVMVPDKYKNYVPFGYFDDLLSIISSKKFYPVFITGPTGNGKSMLVEQVCAQLGRELVIYSMTPESDEGDLLGNYVLINNEMVWRDGAITTAARRGAVVCIDEIDYGAQNLGSLQRVLEGKTFLLKKKGELITPAPGFQIVATANTKGKGSDDGRYMFTNVLNESFLERFPITLEQQWAPNNVEKRIVQKELDSSIADQNWVAPDEEAKKNLGTFAENLVMWATTIRKANEEDDVLKEVISTRRLVHIVRAFPIFNGDRLKAITFCLNRFDNLTKEALIDLYSKVDDSIQLKNTAGK